MTEPEAAHQEAAPDTANDQAEGITFALRSIAETRERAKRAKDRLNGNDNVRRHAIFLPDTHRTHPQAIAHAAILSYYTELCKRPYIEAVGAQDFMKQPYTSTKIPEVVGEEEAVVELEPDPYGQFPDEPDYNMEPVHISLETIPWWSMQFLKIKKKKTSSWGTENTTVENKKIVLPPKVIDDTYARLDELASQMNVLLNIQGAEPHGST